MSAPSTPADVRSSRAVTPRCSNRGRDSLTPALGYGTPSPNKKAIQHVASPLPDGMSLRHAHPTAILDRLLVDISHTGSRHHARYSSLLQSQGDNLKMLLHRCIRAEVWQAVSNQTHAAPSQSRHIPLSTLSSLGGDLSSYGRAVYLHILYFAPPARPRLYIGQAFNLAARIKNQHMDFRYRRDHPSLHNFAMDRSLGDEYVVLAVVKDPLSREDGELVLNLLEMWMALWVGTLPGHVMRQWLGAEERRCEGRREWWGLNVAEPLDQGGTDSEAWKVAFEQLKESEDGMAREYFWDVRKRPRPVVAKQLEPVFPNKQMWFTYVPLGLGMLAMGFMVGTWTARIRRGN